MNKLNQTIILLILIIPFLSNGQGWEKMYDGGLNEIAYASDKTLDGGIIMAGTQSGAVDNIDHSFLYKIDVDGNLQWEFFDSIHVGSFVNTLDVLSTSDGNFLLSSIYGNTPPNNNAVVQKIAPGGTVLWENSLTTPYLDYAPKMAETADGDYILGGTYSTPLIDISLGVVKLDSDGILLWEVNFEEIDTPYFIGGVSVASNGDILVSGYIGYLGEQNAFVKRLDTNGNVIWEKEYDKALTDYAFDMVELDNGDLVVSGSITNDVSGSIVRDLSLLKIDADGNEIWFNSYDIFDDQTIKGIEKTADGGFVLAGFYDPGSSIVVDIYLLKVDADGNQIWVRDYGRSKNDISSGVFSAPNDGFFIAGYTQKDNDSYDAYLIKTDSLGFSFTNELSGNLFHDENLDCVLDATENGLNQWLIEVEKENDYFMTTTDELGNYSFTLDTGTYEMTIHPISPYWGLCDSSIQINFPTFFDSFIQDIGAQGIIDCPLLDISIGTPFLRRCFENDYVVQYCNYGTNVAEDASVTVTIDPAMEVLFTSIDIENIIDDVNYVFDIGDVGIGECGEIDITVLLGNTQIPCDSIPLGATHCVEAHISPDSICMPNGTWSGASVEVDAICSNDSVVFLIKNVGTAPTQPNLSYLIIEDDVVLLDGGFSLDPNETESISIATNGATFRLEAQQEPNHPGMSMPSVSVENCGTPNSTFTFGFVNIFAQDDGDPFVDIDCQDNIGAYDPNDKRGYPLGYGDENYINRGQDIEYMIRFQNTGTDTAFNIVIQDELSEMLDITSIRPGASSHPYRFNISNDRMLSFAFDNIMLPDSNVNEPASNGFVKFKIAQQPNLPLETKIYNAAGIYFDFNAPIITNQTVHTIGENLITVSIDDIENQSTNVKVFPNPFSDFVKIEVEDLKIENGAFKLFDATGRLLRKQNFDNTSFTFYKKDLGTGMYFFTIENNGQLISSGKLIAQ